MNLGGYDINVHAGRPSLGPASLSYMHIATFREIQFNSIAS